MQKDRRDWKYWKDLNVDNNKEWIWENICKIRIHGEQRRGYQIFCFLNLDIYNIGHKSKDAKKQNTIVTKNVTHLIKYDWKRVFVHVRLYQNYCLKKLYEKKIFKY